MIEGDAHRPALTDELLVQLAAAASVRRPSSSTCCSTPRARRRSRSRRRRPDPAAANPAARTITFTRRRDWDIPSASVVDAARQRPPPGPAHGRDRVRRSDASTTARRATSSRACTRRRRGSPSRCSTTRPPARSCIESGGSTLVVLRRRHRRLHPAAHQLQPTARRPGRDPHRRADRRASINGVPVTLPGDRRLPADAALRRLRDARHRRRQDAITITRSRPRQLPRRGLRAGQFIRIVGGAGAATATTTSTPSPSPTITLTTAIGAAGDRSRERDRQPARPRRASGRAGDVDLVDDRLRAGSVAAASSSGRTTARLARRRLPRGPGVAGLHDRHGDLRRLQDRADPRRRTDQGREDRSSPPRARCRRSAARASVTVTRIAAVATFTGDADRRERLVQAAADRARRPTRSTRCRPAARTSRSSRSRRTCSRSCAARWRSRAAPTARRPLAAERRQAAGREGRAAVRDRRRRRRRARRSTS